MRSPLTTHVLDTARGCPAAGLRITLAQRVGEAWQPLADVETNADGRVDAPLLPPGGLQAAVYRLVFHTGDWFTATGQAGFYPEATVVFRVTAPDEHHHVPLLLSPFGYSTYRGS
ncbi:MAG: hydroxyisourate hydrolase [Myxococcales bacterium]|nr:hydroxyisourate hydrolase [Myxococcales bacterium]